MKTRRMDDLLPQLQELYPEVDREVLREIIKTGFRNMNTGLAKGGELVLESLFLGIKFQVYYPTFQPVCRNYGYYGNKTSKTR